MLAGGASLTSIAKQLGRHRTTISRELRRNGVRGMYLAVDAQQVAERRRRAARAMSRKLNRPENLAYVEERLRQCWSPDQIAGRSRWIVYFRHYRRKRRRTKSAGHVDRALGKRPQIVNERGRFGDWEGDTIIGSGRHGGALVSLVERRSGYLALLPVPSKHAKKVRQAMCGTAAASPTRVASDHDLGQWKRVHGTCLLQVV